MIDFFSDDLVECSAGLRDETTYRSAQHMLLSKAYGHEAQRCMSASGSSGAYETGSKRAMATKMSVPVVIRQFPGPPPLLKKPPCAKSCAYGGACRHLKIGVCTFLHTKEEVRCAALFFCAFNFYLLHDHGDVWMQMDAAEIFMGEAFDRSATPSLRIFRVCT
jgi:hypothetical protein